MAVAVNWLPARAVLLGAHIRAPALWKFTKMVINISRVLMTALTAKPGPPRMPCLSFCLRGSQPQIAGTQPQGTPNREIECQIPNKSQTSLQVPTWRSVGSYNQTSFKWTCGHKRAMLGSVYCYLEVHECLKMFISRVRSRLSVCHSYSWAYNCIDNQAWTSSRFPDTHRFLAAAPPTSFRSSSRSRGSESRAPCPDLYL